MKTVFAIGLMLGSIATACAGTDAASLLKQLEASRNKLPAFAGLYRELVEVPNDKGPSPDEVQNGHRTRLSWGDHNTDWLYEYAFGPKGSYSHFIGDPKDATFKNIDEKSLIVGPKMYQSVSGGRQGLISESKPGLFNPAGAGYELNMGEPVTELLAANSPTLVDPHTLQIRAQSRTVNVHLADLKGQLAVDRITSSYDSGMIEMINVNSWRAVKGGMIPEKVTVQRTRGGAAFQTIRYELVKPMAKPEQLLVWQGWRENAIVKDHTNQVVYQYTGGKLIPHPLFNKGGSAAVTVERSIALMGALVLAFCLIRAIKAKSVGPRLPEQADSAPTGSRAEVPSSGGTATRIPGSP